MKLTRCGRGRKSTQSMKAGRKNAEDEEEEKEEAGGLVA